MAVIYFKRAGNQRIEPVRSARPVTIRLWHAYHGVIFYSGANTHVLQQIQSQNIPALTEGSDGGTYFARAPSRRAPHNLYTDGDRLTQGLKKYAPRVAYQLPSPGTPAASPAPAVANRVVFNQTNAPRVAYTYPAPGRAYSCGAGTRAPLAKQTGPPLRPTHGNPS